jgi:hypothetical protein
MRARKKQIPISVEKASNKLLALTELDSDAWVSEIKRISGKKQPLSSAGLRALRDDYTRTIEPGKDLTGLEAFVFAALTAPFRTGGRTWLRSR